MNWLGIGVLVIGVALLIISIGLLKPLNKLANVLGSVKDTTDKLPDTIDHVTQQTTEVMQKANLTLDQVNEKVAQLTPVFEIVGDAGRASRHISATAVEATMAMKNNTAEGRDAADAQGLNGVYGALSLGYYLYEKRKALKHAIDTAK